ncbi:hypothetical protein [Mucilaginibacter sp.]
MKSLKVLTVLMLTVFSYTAVNAQVHHHYKKHYVKHHVIIHHHR